MFEFEFIKKLMFGTSKLPEVEEQPIEKPVEPVKQPTLYDCEKILVGKYFTEELVRELPSYLLDYLMSDITIESDGKKYRVGCYQHYNTAIYFVRYDVFIIIEEIKIVPRDRKVCIRYITDNTEKCKFILNNLEQVELSLNDIAHKCDILANERAQKKACVDKCATSLFDKLS